MKTGVNKKRVEELKKILLGLQREIIAELKKSMGENMEEDVRMSFELTQDNADRSVDELSKHVSATIASNKSVILDRINEALIKLDQGTYGICEECGAEIPLKRLKILPFATLCVACQADEEKKAGEQDEYGYKKQIPAEDEVFSYDDE